MNMAVYLFVCPLAELENHTAKPPIFLGMLPVAVTQSSSDGVAIRYVLPVLWMTSCFRTIGPVDQNLARRYV